MVNIRGDRRHDSRADDRLMYGDVHSPGKRPLCSFLQAAAMLVAAAILTTRVVWVTGKYYVRQAPETLS